MSHRHQSLVAGVCWALVGLFFVCSPNAGAVESSSSSKINQNQNIRSAESEPTNFPVRVVVWTTPQYDWDSATGEDDGPNVAIFQTLKEVVIGFGDAIQFRPLMYINSGKEVCSVDASGNPLDDSAQLEVCSRSCHNNHRYCSPPPTDPIHSQTAGKLIVEESLRRLCLWNAYGMDGNWDMERTYFDYLQEFHKNKCDAKNYQPECVEGTMKLQGIDDQPVEECIELSGSLQDDAENKVLQAQVDFQAQNKIDELKALPAVFVNDVFQENVTVDGMFAAICATIPADKRPGDVCEGLLPGEDQDPKEEEEALEETLGEDEDPKEEKEAEEVLEEEIAEDLGEENNKDGDGNDKEVEEAATEESNEQDGDGNNKEVEEAATEESNEQEEEHAETSEELELEHEAEVEENEEDVSTTEGQDTPATAETSAPTAAPSSAPGSDSAAETPLDTPETSKTTTSVPPHDDEADASAAGNVLEGPDNEPSPREAEPTDSKDGVDGDSDIPTVLAPTGEGGDFYQLDAQLVNAAMDHLAVLNKCEVDTSLLVSKLVNLGKTDGNFKAGVEAIESDMPMLMTHTCPHEQGEDILMKMEEFHRCSMFNLQELIETFPSTAMGILMRCANAYSKMTKEEEEAGYIPEACIRTVEADSVLGRGIFGLYLYPDVACPCFEKLHDSIPECTADVWPIPVNGALVKVQSCLAGQYCQTIDGMCEENLSSLNDCLPKKDVAPDAMDCKAIFEQCSAVYEHVPPMLTAAPLPDACVRVATGSKFYGTHVVERYDVFRHQCGENIELWEGHTPVAEFLAFAQDGITGINYKSMPFVSGVTGGFLAGIIFTIVFIIVRNFCRWLRACCGRCFSRICCCCRGRNKRPMGKDYETVNTKGEEIADIPEYHD